MTPDDDFQIVSYQGRRWYQQISTGRFIPYVSGGDGPDDEDDDEDDEDDDLKGANHKNRKGKVLTETDIRRIMKQEKDAGKVAGQTALLKELGFDKADDLKEALGRLVEIDSAKDDEKDRKIKTLERDIKSLKEGSALQTSLSGERVLALVDAGMTVAAARLSAKLLDHVNDIDELPDAVEELKTAMPQLFAKANADDDDPDDDGNNQSRKNSRMNRGNQPNSATGRPPGGGNRNPKPDAAKAARERLESRHPDKLRKDK